ncbi:two-component system response regulator YesN [Lederbergia galactosidilyticus]|uniref:response regulator n=1 Tax=Lederbergia galactosidilytica TaxID=217031 RepID=UPI001AE950DD|nr:helix-turn-helix domain-containing protein [Lederbergia galactosidilytica]MBP1915769.1 two-component system response regulator YesN [Lederbergia galactosidilytica]
MYKVMLVDDDYPAIEFLSEMIEWNELNIELQSTHENGANALAYAQTDMPDILITDIGMPKMDGLELTKKMKQRKPDLQVAILSCHNEFTYAQKAIKLGVQDYILKETLDPEDLTELLMSIKENLENNQRKNLKRLKLENAVERSKHLAKEKFIKELIYQSPNAKKDWCYENNFSGFKLEKRDYIPVLCFIEDYNALKASYASEDTFQFAVQNVIEEVVHNSEYEDKHFVFEEYKSFMLIPYQPSLKIDNFGEAANLLRVLQKTLKDYLNIQMSFLIGEKIAPEDLQFELTNLLASNTQRFYMEPSAIMRRKETHDHNTEDLFHYYDQAAVELRRLIFKKEIRNIPPYVTKWLDFIQENTFHPEVIKEWILKLLLELKIKLKALQYFQTSFNLEILHKEIVYIETITALKTWFIDCLESAIILTTESLYSSKHKEILEACIYVSLNIEKKLYLDEVANHIFLNPSYFSRLFKKEMGKTFVEYVKSIKVERAKELLDQTTHSISEICERLGYDNQSYFIKLFKKHEGLTPAEYREIQNLPE